MPNLDQVILVTADDQPIGTMDKVGAHRGQAQRHRAISVYLFNSQDELLIQQRSAQKIVGAGQWANTCCGNLRPGESYENCARRRLREELGITQVKLKPIYKFEYQVQCNAEFSEWEMDQVFVGRYDGKVQPVTNEVGDIQWVKIDDLLTQIDNPKYALWFQIMMNDSQLLTHIRKFVW